jgi:hypothetical protein
MCTARGFGWGADLVTAAGRGGAPPRLDCTDPHPDLDQRAATGALFSLAARERGASGRDPTDTALPLHAGSRAERKPRRQARPRDLSCCAIAPLPRLLPQYCKTIAQI